MDLGKYMKNTYQIRHKLAGCTSQYFILRILKGDKVVAVHTNKNRAILQKMACTRYGASV